LRGQLIYDLTLICLPRWSISRNILSHIEMVKFTHYYLKMDQEEVVPCKSSWWSPVNTVLTLYAMELIQHLQCLHLSVLFCSHGANPPPSVSIPPIVIIVYLLKVMRHTVHWTPSLVCPKPSFKDFGLFGLMKWWNPMKDCVTRHILFSRTTLIYNYSFPIISQLLEYSSLEVVQTLSS